MVWKDRAKKFWNFLWHDDSLASWIANVVVAFVVIKFVFYPLLGMAFGTSFPVVAVISESMEHDQDLEAWWEDNKEFYLTKNITLEEFESFRFDNGFNKGDIMVLVGVEPGEVEKGDVLVYQSGKPYPIIHRTVEIKNRQSGFYYGTKGDNNERQIVDFDLDETNVPHSQVYGKAVVRIPYLGYVKIAFVELVRLIAYPMTS